MTTTSDKPVTRATSAYVRDKGLRQVMATITGSLIELRCKGLRSREYLDIGWCYQQGVKQRIGRERADKAKARKARKP